MARIDQHVHINNIKTNSTYVRCLHDRLGCNKTGQINVTNTTKIEEVVKQQQQNDSSKQEEAAVVVTQEKSKEESKKEVNSATEQEGSKNDIIKKAEEKDEDYERYKGLWTVQNYLSNPLSVSTSTR